MRFDIITIFPDAFDGYLHSSIIGRAVKQKLVDARVHDLRRWTHDRHRSVDDKPFGGGPGMVMKPEPLFAAIRSVLPRRTGRTRVIVLSAKGKLFTQAKAKQLYRKYDRIVLVCGHYEGIDERVARHMADEELSIGEYVLTGGELPALVVLDAVSRHIPGVLGKQESLAEESFSRQGAREYPHYTRPETLVARDKKGSKRAMRVPKALVSGNHALIADWRKTHSVSEEPGS